MPSQVKKINMSEIRKDPVFGRWIILAFEREARPNEFKINKGNKYCLCPFCAGNEQMTPPESFSIRDEKGNWKLRVVPNKFPALCGNSPLKSSYEGIYESLNGSGKHEVLIETPDHTLHLEDQPVDNIASIIKTIAKRAKAMEEDPLIKYVMVFKNHGKNAGASLLHPHSQIVGMPLIPLRVLQEIEGSERYFKEHNSCVFCDMAKEESSLKKRVIAENDDFIVITPYASRFAFELWAFSKTHQTHFETISDNLALSLAEVLKISLKKLYNSLDNLCYNLIIHSTPPTQKAGSYHWHIEIMPKLNFVAGFEWGTGFYINTLSPEKAADILNSGKKYK